MTMRGNRFETDKANGKLLGVCAGIANQTGIDATFVRIGFVLAALVTAFWLALVVYGVLAFVGASRSRPSHSLARAATREQSRERMRDLDLRMQAIETYVTSSNSRLAREIEDLR